MKELSEFIAGFVAGLGVIFFEFQLFVGNLVYNTISTNLVTSQSETLFLGVTVSFLILNFGGILLNFLIGYLRPIFAWGLFVGNLIIILLLGGPLFTTMPEVLFGLILVCVSVLVGLFIRPNNNHF